MKEGFISILFTESWINKECLSDGLENLVILLEDFIKLIS